MPLLSHCHLWGTPHCTTHCLLHLVTLDEDLLYYTISDLYNHIINYKLLQIVLVITTIINVDRVVQASTVPTSRLLASYAHHINAALQLEDTSSADSDSSCNHFIAVGDSAGVAHIFSANDLKKVDKSLSCLHIY